MTSSPGNSRSIPEPVQEAINPVKRAFANRSRLNWETYFMEFLTGTLSLPLSESLSDPAAWVNPSNMFGREGESILKGWHCPILKKAGETYVFQHMHKKDDDLKCLVYTTDDKSADLIPLEITHGVTCTIIMRAIQSFTLSKVLAEDRDWRISRLVLFFFKINSCISKRAAGEIAAWASKQFKHLEKEEDFESFYRLFRSEFALTNILRELEEDENRVTEAQIEALVAEQREEAKRPQQEKLDELSKLLSAHQITFNWFDAVNAAHASEPIPTLEIFPLSQELECKISSGGKEGAWTGIKIPSNFESTFPYGYKIISEAAQSQNLLIEKTQTAIVPQCLNCFTDNEEAQDAAIAALSTKEQNHAVFFVARHLENYTELVSKNLINNEKSQDFVFFQITTLLSAYYEHTIKVGAKTQQPWYRQKDRPFRTIMKDHWSVLVGPEAAEEIIAATETIYKKVVKNTISESPEKKAYMDGLARHLTNRFTVKAPVLFARLLPTRTVTITEEVKEVNSRGKLTGKTISEKKKVRVKVHPKIETNAPITTFESLVFKNVNSALNGISKFFIKDLAPDQSPKDWSDSIQAEINRESADLAEINLELNNRKDAVRSTIRSRIGKDKPSTEQWIAEENALIERHEISYNNKTIKLLNQLIGKELSKEAWKTASSEMIGAGYLQKRKS